MSREALGKGLGELLGEIETAYKNENNKYVETVDEIDVELFDPNPKQPRTQFKKEQIDELSLSIQEHGLLQPIVATRNGQRYTLISGERRLRATKEAKIKKIKTIILSIDLSKLSELALIENIQREDLNPMELAISYDRLIKEHSITHEQLAKKISKSRSSITNILRLLNLSKYAKKKLLTNEITLGHAKLIILLDEKNQKIAVDSIVAQKLSVHDTNEMVKNLKTKNQTTIKPTKLKKPNLDTKALNSIVSILKKDGLKTILKDGYIKIEFKDNDDIIKLSKLIGDIK